MLFEVNLSKVFEAAAIALLIICGLTIFFTVLPNFSVYYGDDTPLGAHFVAMTAQNFPFYLWEPYYYVGHPIVGVGTTVFIIPAALLNLGVSVTNSLYVSFLMFFLLIGIGLYLLAKQMAPKIIALSIPFIAWFSTTLWNATIWGGSYDRAFALAYLYLGFAATYWYVSKGLNTNIKEYLSMLSMWVIILLANQHIAYQFIMFTLPFMVFAYGNVKVGIKKFAILIFPALGLTFFNWGRTAYYLLTTPNVSPNNDLTIYPISWLYTSGIQFQHAVGYLPVPIILIASAFLAYAHFTKKLALKPIQKGAIVALILPGAYYFIMGWVTPLWPFLPRIEAALDNIANLNALFLFAMPLLIGILYQAFTGDARMEKTRPMYSQEKIGFTMIGVILIVAALGNAALVVPVLHPADWTPFSNDLNAMTWQYGAVSSPEYRLSTSFKYLLSWVTYSNPHIESTGGRVPILDSRPLYDSWYNDAVFFGNKNPSTLVFPLIEDTPQYQPYFAADARNTATSLFWQDWYGSRVSIVSQYEPSQSEMGIYGLQPFFNVSSAADYGISIETMAASTPYTGTIAEQTNAKVVGFIGTATDYNELLALLSYVGLGPSYVIPLKLNVGDLGHAQLDALLVDETVYAADTSAFDAFSSARGVNLIITNPSDLNRLVSLGPTGSYSLIQLLLPSIMSTMKTQPSGRSGFSALTISTTAWSLGALSQNINRSADWYTWLVPNHNNFVLPLRTPFWLDTNATYAVMRSELPFSVPLGDISITMSLLSTSNGSAKFNFITVNNVNTTSRVVPLVANQKTAFAINGNSLGNGSTWVNRVFLLFNATHPQYTKETTFEALQPQITLTPSGNGYVYSLPHAVVDRPNLALKLDGTTDGDINVEIKGNSSSAEAISIPTYNGTTIIPLTLLSGRASSFNQIIISAPVNAVSLISFNSQAQMPLTHTWVDGNNGVINGITGGFRGVVWKETYYPNWKFHSGADTLQAYYAGPSLTYIPLPSSGVGSIGLSLNVYDSMFIISLALVIAIVMGLSLWMLHLMCFTWRQKLTTQVLAH